MKFKGYLVLCTTFILLSCSNREKVSIDKVEHFYISTNNALVTFKIFTEQFGLPIVWDYQNWGGFSSGGVTLGNAVIELIEGQPSQTMVNYGIALEPNQSLKRTIPFLNALNIAHGRINRASKWSTMSFTHLQPNNLDLFLCDYHDRDATKLNRKMAADELLENKGGALGIQILKEIIIATEDPVDIMNTLTKIPGIENNTNEFNLSEGPNLKVIKSDITFLGLLLKVNSIGKAKMELESLGFKTRNTNQGIEIIDERFSINIALIE